MITLKEYIDRMKDKQENIFYITGDNIEALENSPQMEGFKDRDIEVLYLTDTVDNFWVTTQHDFQGKELKSITREDIDLNNLNGELEKTEENKEDIKFDDENKSKEENAKNITESQYDGLITFIKEVLKDKIKDVKISKKLTSSPVCLVSDKQAMDIRLERYLLDQKQIPYAMKKIIEINPKHQIIQNINTNLSKPEKLTELQELVNLLFDEACIIEGEPIANPGEFAKMLNKLLEIKK